jgi:hypothetical protein
VKEELEVVRLKSCRKIQRSRNSRNPRSMAI